MNGEKEEYGKWGTRDRGRSQRRRRKSKRSGRECGRPKTKGKARPRRGGGLSKGENPRGRECGKEGKRR